MKQDLAKILGVVLQQLDAFPDASISVHSMRRWLSGQGYKARDIDAVLKMVSPRLAASATQHQHPRPLRHLSDFEISKMTPEARAALARLELYDLIMPFEREMILDRLGQFENEVTMDDLDAMVSWVLGSTRDVESQQTIFEVFEGGDYTLH